MTIKHMHINKDIILNTDLGFANRIISKYSITGKYFFEGISLTFLDMNQAEVGENENQSNIYLSLKLLIAYNYQQLYDTMISNKALYMANLNKVLQNQLNQLKVENANGYEYINNIYHLVNSKVDSVSRERIQYLLEEKIKVHPLDNRNNLSVEQIEVLKSISHVKNSNLFKGKNYDQTLTSDRIASGNNANIEESISLAGSSNIYSDGNISKNSDSNESKNDERSLSFQNNEISEEGSNSNRRLVTDGIEINEGSNNTDRRLATDGSAINEGSININKSEYSDEKRIENISKTEMKEISNNFASSNYINVNSSIDISESMDQSTNADIYFEHSNNLINLLHKSKQGLTREEKNIFHTIIRNLSISKEDKDFITKGIEQNETASSKYNNSFERLSETFTKEIKKEQFLKEMKRNEIHISEFEKFSQYLLNRKDYVNQKDILINYVKKSAPSIQNQLVEMLWQQEVSKNNSVSGRDLVHWLNNSTDKELVQFVEVLEENKQRIYNHILKQHNLGTNLNRVDQKNENNVIINNEMINTANRIISEVINVKEFRSNPILQKENVLESNHILKKENMLQEYFIGSIPYVFSSLKLLNQNLGIYANRKLIKEKLIDILTSGLDKENSNILNTIQTIYSRKEIRTLQNRSYSTESSYNDFNETNDLVLLIQNADASQLHKMIQVVCSNKFYGGRVLKALLQEEVLNKELGESGLKISGTEEKNLTISSLSSIKLYQELLLEKYNRNEVKEKLIKTIRNSSKKETLIITELVKNSFSEGVIAKLVNTSTKRLVNSSNNSFHAENLIYFIQNTNDTQLEQLLQVLHSDKILSESIMSELLDKQLHRKIIQKMASERAVNRRSTRNKSDISSIKWNLQKQLQKSKDNYLKEKLINMLTLGGNQENVALVNTIKSQFSEEVTGNVLTKNEKILVNSSRNYIETEDLIYFIRRADENQLERIAEVISLSPEYSQRMNTILSELKINNNKNTDMTKVSWTAFESSIIKNKLNLEQSHRIIGNTTKHQLLEIINNGTRQEQRSLIEFIDQQPVLLESKKRVGNVPALHENSELNREYLKKIIKEAHTTEFEKFIKIYQEEVLRVQATTERNMTEQDIFEQLSKNNWEADISLNRTVTDVYEQDSLLQNIWKQNILHQDTFKQNILHQDILNQNLLLQKSLLQDEIRTEIINQSGSMEQEELLYQNQEYPLSANQLQHKIERPNDTKEDLVKKIVDDYIYTERPEINYSHNKNGVTKNELNVQKKEIRKLKENLNVQNKAVEELKKQIAMDKNVANKIDINKVSEDIMKKMQQQIMVARLRKGLD